MGSSDANLLAERCDAEMSEDRYVVRDTKGREMAWGDMRTELRQPGDPRTEMTRSDALRLAANCDEERPRYAPHTLFKLKSDTKPKAPRELFTLVDADGNFCGLASHTRWDAMEELGGGCHDSTRVVRYVLAEGEK